MGHLQCFWISKFMNIKSMKRNHKLFMYFENISNVLFNPASPSLQPNIFKLKIYTIKSFYINFMLDLSH